MGDLHSVRGGARDQAHAQEFEGGSHALENSYRLSGHQEAVNCCNLTARVSSYSTHTLERESP